MDTVSLLRRSFDDTLIVLTAGFMCMLLVGAATNLKLTLGETLTVTSAPVLVLFAIYAVAECVRGRWRHGLLLISVPGSLVAAIAVTAALSGDDVLGLPPDSTVPYSIAALVLAIGFSVLIVRSAEHARGVRTLALIIYFASAPLGLLWSLYDTSNFWPSICGVLVAMAFSILVGALAEWRMMTADLAAFARSLADIIAGLRAAISRAYVHARERKTALVRLIERRWLRRMFRKSHA